MDRSHGFGLLVIGLKARQRELCEAHRRAADVHRGK
jgi:hypothetical protein